RICARHFPRRRHRSRRPCRAPSHFVAGDPVMSPADRARLAIHNRADAEALLMRISDSMVALVKIFEDETRLIKAGRLREASMLVEEKTALASEYLRLIETMKANAEFIGGELPTLVEDLRRAHAAFRDILALNLRVVAT